MWSTPLLKDTGDSDGVTLLHPGALANADRKAVVLVSYGCIVNPVGVPRDSTLLAAVRGLIPPLASNIYNHELNC